jgi:hypothetical protein
MKYENVAKPVGSGQLLVVIPNPLFQTLFLSSRRDVPVERLSRVVRATKKGGIKSGFGISGHWSVVSCVLSLNYW